MRLHRDATGQSNIHVIHAFTFADTAEREAGTGYTLTAADVLKVAFQEDDETYWVLTDDSPITWVQIGGGGSSVGKSSRVARTSNQTIATSTSTAISFDSEIYDDGGFWAIGNPTRLTAPVDGYYEVWACVRWANNATGRRLLFYKKNATTDMGPEDGRPGNSVADTTN